MSIWSLFQSTDEQEETSNAYQSWRDENPDNPSDDDFYGDEDDDAYMYRQESDVTVPSLSQEEYKAETDQLYANGYYDDVVASLDDADSSDNSGSGIFGWFCR